MVVILNFCFKKFRFGLHTDSVVLVDFRHVLTSVEVRFISAPNPFEQRLVSFAAIAALLTHPGMYFALVCLV